MAQAFPRIVPLPEGRADAPPEGARAINAGFVKLSSEGREDNPGFGIWYVNKLLESIAESYNREAQWEDTDARVRSRISY